MKSKKNDATGRKRKSWDKDGSIHVLLDWMTTEGNYSKYWGGDGHNGLTKATTESTISVDITCKLPNVFKTALDVNRKIGQLPTSHWNFPWQRHSKCPQRVIMKAQSFSISTWKSWLQSQGKLLQVMSGRCLSPPSVMKKNSTMVRYMLMN